LDAACPLLNCVYCITQSRLPTKMQNKVLVGNAEEGILLTAQLDATQIGGQ
jgi:hypothetical protein